MNQPEMNRPSITGRAWVRVLLFLISYFIVNSLMQVGGIYLISLFKEMSFTEYLTSFQEQISQSNVSLSTLLVIQTSGLIGMLALVTIFRKKVDGRTLVSLGLSIRGWLRDAAAGLVMGLLLIGIGFLTLFVFGFLTIQSVQFAAGSLALSLLFFLVVSLNEEIMLRGYVLNNLLEQYHPYNALGVTAFLFSIMHGFNPNITMIGFLNIFLAGVLFGIYYIYRRNLWFPIMIHLSWNFFQGPVFGFEVSGLKSISLITHEVEGPFYLTGGSFGFEGSLLLTLLLLAAIWWIYHRYGESAGTA